MTFIYRLPINIAILVCLSLFFAQTASAQFDEKGNFIGSTWSEFPGGAKAVCADDDIDNDNDGLIELCYLEDVDAMRHVLDGSGYQSSSSATKVTTGCLLVEGEETCIGYELVRDLDFNDDASYSSPTNIVKWTTGKGWQPIGYYTDEDDNESFVSIFEGNDHIIFNLTINRSDTNDVGLFGFTGGSSKISNIGLLNVDIDGKNRVGGLVGRNTGSIANSYATGSADGVNNDVGGLVGYNADGSIANSYATVSVTGDENVGGLVALNDSGSIANSYATGSVDGDGIVGGLVGANFNGSIAKSYATGFVTGNDAEIGGLIASSFGSITKSYWDTSTTRVSTSAGGEGKTTVQLQSLPDATDIYNSWSTDDWDFGTSNQYPALKHGGGDASTPACGTPRQQQPACGDLLRGQGRSGKFDEKGNFIGSIWSEFDEDVGAKAACADDDIDNDNDGLIELCYLEDVNAMRHALDGSGYGFPATTTKVTTGCPLVEGREKCRGYELVRDLDFNNANSYSSKTNKIEYTVDNYEDSADNGWQPIGDFINTFNSIFEGNGHTISNLTINRSRTDHVGLFGFTGDSSKISNIGLLNVDVDGRDVIGSLAGRNNGSIANSYAIGSVEGNSNVGGLVDGNDGSNVGGSNVGGLVGGNNGSIVNSYARGSATVAISDVGGLVGFNTSIGSIENSYAISSVSAPTNTASIAAGLVSFNNSGRIENSYAAGFIDATGDNVGGLCGLCFGSTNIKNSYWDTSTTRVSTSAGGEGKTTVQLQSPTEATGIYSSWNTDNTDNWDFGTPNQYPALKHARGDADNPACGTPQQPECGALLRGQGRNSQPRIIVPQNNDEIRIRESDVNTTKTIAVTVFDYDAADELTLFLSAVEDQNLVVLETTKTTVRTNGKFKRDINEDLSIKVPQELISGMTTLQLVAKDDSGSGNAMSKPILLQVLVGNIQPTILPNAAPKIVTVPASVTVKKGGETTFEVTASDADIDDVLTLELTAADPTQTTVGLVTREVEVATDSTETRAVWTLRIKGLKEGTATLNVVVSDGLAESQASVDVVVKDNAVPEITAPASVTVREGREVTFEVTVSDADVDDTGLDLITNTGRPGVIELIDEGQSSLMDNTKAGYVQTFKVKGLQPGTVSVEIVATDGVDSSQPAAVNVTVEPNASPMVVIENVTTQVVTIGETLSLKTGKFFEDSDDTELSYEVSGFPPGYRFSFSTTGTLTVTPGIEDASKNKLGVPLTVKAIDGSGSSAQAMFTLLVDDETDATIRIRDVSKRQLRAEISYEMDENGIAERKYQWFRNDTVIPNETTNTYIIKDNPTDRAVGTSYKAEVTFVDNIGQEVILPSSNEYTVENEAPVIDSVMPTKQNYDEGERVSVTTSASDANNDVLTYTWHVTSGDKDPSILTGVTTNTESISFKVPADWVINSSTATGVTETLHLEVTVSDGNLSTTQTATVVVTKINNGNAFIPSITVDPNNPNGFIFEQIDLTQDPDGKADDVNIISNLNYRWQHCSASADCSSGGDWTNIGMPITDTTNPLSLTPSDFGVDDRLRVKITYTDGQGYNENLLSGIYPAVKIRAKVFLEGPLQ